jgi:bifunctional DNA-binding transcriptional regulator/antitoxin component of YhaV-PrlF toxin-antitoxin module
LDREGKILLPKELVEKLHLFEGDELIIRFRDYKIPENENIATWEIILTSGKYKVVNGLN